MIPSRFEYHAPSTLDEAISLLAGYGPEASVLAGGQSLIPMMKFQKFQLKPGPDALRVPGTTR